MAEPSVEKPSIDHGAAEARALRVWAAVVGGPLLVTVLVPIYVSHQWYSAPAFAVEVHRPELFPLPVVGLALVVIALVPKLSLTTRSLVALLSAVTILFVVHKLAEDPHVARDVLGPLRRVDRSALEWLLLSPVLGAAADVAMARRVREKRWAIVAAIAWLHVLARLAMPLSRGDFDSSPLAAMVDAGEPGAILTVLPFACLSFLGLGRCAWRLVRRRAALDRKKPGWAWVAGLFALPPSLILGILGGGLALLNYPEHVTIAFDASVLVFAVLAGGAMGLGHGALVLHDGLVDFARRLVGRDARRRRGARIAAGALLLVVLVFAGRWAWRVFGPDPRAGELATLADHLASIIVTSGMGGDYDTSVLGGYSAFDLRDTVGSLAEHVPNGATPEVITVGIELSAHADRLRFRTRIVVLSGSLVRWTEVELGHHANAMRDLSLADDALAGAATLTADRLTDSCVSIASPDELAELPDEWTGALSTVRAACDHAEPEEPRFGYDDGLDDDAAAGELGDYVILLRAGDRRLLLTGRLYNDAGRLWVGRFDVRPVE